jgi:serralysin
MNVINGTAGNDRIDETKLHDVITTFGGNDIVNLFVNDDFGGDNQVDTGAGNDQVFIAFSTGNTVLLGEGDDIFVIEADGLLPGLNRVDAGAGNDTLGIGSQNGQYAGGAGNDSFVSEAFQNELDGGDGNDTVSYIASESAINADMAASAVFTGASLREDIFNFENLTGSDFNDVIFGNTGDNVLRGGAGNDQIDGDPGNDQLFGDAGNDLLLGGEGNDTINGGAGSDQMAGGNGNDTYVVDAAADIIEETAAGGSDRVVSFINFTLGANLERLDLTGSAVIGTGNSLNNTMIGSAGANTLNGGDGNDAFNSGLGNDTLTGGAGADSFFFATALNSATNVDRITDYSLADQFRLDDAIFTGLSAGTLAATAFKTIGVAGAVVDADDRIIYDTSTGNLYFDVNGSSAGGAAHIARLTAGLALNAAEFTIF